jgi:hypothetical protein
LIMFPPPDLPDLSDPPDPPIPPILPKKNSPLRRWDVGLFRLPFLILFPNTMKKRMLHMLAAVVASVACLASISSAGKYVLYDDFTYPNTSFDRAKWWRGGLAGVDGGNAILNESDLTSVMMFLEGDFKFVIGGPSASSQGLFGLGDIDDGDPYLILSNSGGGWRFHAANGAKIYTGPVVASSLAKGDVIVFHWDSSGASVSINGMVKDSQTTAHPPHMPLTMLEWNNSSTSGQIVMAYPGGIGDGLRL